MLLQLKGRKQVSCEISSFFALNTSYLVVLRKVCTQNDISFTCDHLFSNYCGLHWILPRASSEHLLKFHLKRKVALSSQVQCSLVESKVSSLNSGDVFLLVTPNELYHFVGDDANVHEKAKVRTEGLNHSRGWKRVARGWDHNLWTEHKKLSGYWHFCWACPNNNIIIFFSSRVMTLSSVS